MYWQEYFKLLRQGLIWCFVPIFIFYIWYGSMLFIFSAIQDLDKTLILFHELVSQLISILKVYIYIMAFIWTFLDFRFIITKPYKKEEWKKN